MHGLSVRSLVLTAEEDSFGGAQDPFHYNPGLQEHALEKAQLAMNRVCRVNALGLGVELGLGSGVGVGGPSSMFL